MPPPFSLWNNEFDFDHSCPLLTCYSIWSSLLLHRSLKFSLNLGHLPNVIRTKNNHSCFRLLFLPDIKWLMVNWWSLSSLCPLSLMSRLVSEVDDQLCEFYSWSVTLFLHWCIMIDSTYFYGGVQMWANFCLLLEDGTLAHCAKCTEKSMRSARINLVLNQIQNSKIQTENLQKLWKIAFRAVLK